MAAQKVALRKVWLFSKYLLWASRPVLISCKISVNNECTENRSWKSLTSPIKYTLLPFLKKSSTASSFSSCNTGTQIATSSTESQGCLLAFGEHVPEKCLLRRTCNVARCSNCKKRGWSLTQETVAFLSLLMLTLGPTYAQERNGGGNFTHYLSCPLSHVLNSLSFWMSEHSGVCLTVVKVTLFNGPAYSSRCTVFGNFLISLHHREGMAENSGEHKGTTGLWVSDQNDREQVTNLGAFTRWRVQWIK